MSTVVYMLVMLSMGAGMVMLLCGFSSMHTSLYALQSAVDEQESLLRRTSRVQQDMTKQLNSWKMSVDDLASKQQQLQSSVESQDQSLLEAKEASKQGTAQLGAVQQSVDNLKFHYTKVARTDTDLAQRLQEGETSLQAVEDKIVQVQQLIDASNEQSKAWQDVELQFQASTRDAEKELQGLVRNLTQVVGMLTAEQRKEPAAARPSAPGAPAATSRATAEKKLAETTAKAMTTPSSLAIATTRAPPDAAATTRPTAAATTPKPRDAPTANPGPGSTASDRVSRQATAAGRCFHLHVPAEASALGVLLEPSPGAGWIVKELAPRGPMVDWSARCALTFPDDSLRKGDVIFRVNNVGISGGTDALQRELVQGRQTGREIFMGVYRET